MHAQVLLSRFSAITLIFMGLLPALSMSRAGAAEPLRQSADKVELLSGDLALPLQLACPRFIFSTGQAGGTQLPTQTTGNLLAGEELVAQYAPLTLGGATLEVKLHLAWSAAEGVLRKWAEYRLNPAPAGCVLQEIQFDQLSPVAGETIGFLPSVPQSQPGFLRGFFAALEFPAASTRLEGGKLIVAQRPGRLLQGDSGWRTSYKAVYGAAPVGLERVTFAALITRHRPTPQGLHFNYNSWWSMGFPFSEQQVLDLMKKFADNLYKPHGVAFDTFAIDMGWSDPQSLWQINATLFPQGFANIKLGAEKMGADLGLWISPSSCYPPALDNEWAKNNGYETYLTGLDGKFRAACIAGPKYAEAFKTRLVQMVTQQGVRHIKLDGFWWSCNESGHGHQPGTVDSAEATAEGAVRAFEAVRAAAPEVWLEPTGFGPNPSPFWLYYVNSVTGTFGDDAPPGRVPAPNFRESSTTGRDYFAMQGAALLPLPAVAQELLGIIHQTNDPFLNDAVDVILRGHAFVPVYVNPIYMNERRWGMLAGLMQWARANAVTLAQTTPLLPEAWQAGGPPRFTDREVMPRQPYGNLHWADGKGLLLLRNPWIKRQTVQLSLGAQVGMPAGTEGLTAVSLYPEVRLYGQGLSAQSTLEVPLAPYETLLISLAPGLETAGVKPVAQAIGQQVTLAPGPTTSLVDDGTNVVMAVDAQVTVAAGFDGLVGELMIVLEGKNHSPEITELALTINGAAVTPSQMHSEAQWSATGLTTPEFWTILKAPLAVGANAIHLNLKADAQARTVSCYAWAYQNTVAAPVTYANALPAPEQLYLDSVAILDRQEVEHQARKVEVSGGGTGKIAAAVAAALDGDIVEIQDSLVYYEPNAIYPQWKPGITLCAKAGESPQLNFEFTDALGGLAPTTSGIQIGSNEGGQLILRSKNDGYYCITANNMPNGSTLRIENCKFTGADSQGRNRWKGGGLITNTGTSSTTNVDNCDFYDICDNANNPFAVYCCPGPDTGSTLNITNSRFGASVEGGGCQYILHPSTGSTLSIDRSTFMRGYYQINAGNGTVNVTRSIFEKAAAWTVFVNPNSPSITMSRCAFWNMPAHWFIYVASTAPAVPELTLDHCDFAGEAALRGGPAISTGGDNGARITVTNCNIGLTSPLSAGANPAQTLSLSYAYNDFPLAAAVHDGWSNGGHNLLANSGALAPDYVNPPTDWHYTTASLLSADSAGGPLGSMLPDPEDPSNPSRHWMMFQ